MHGNPCLSREVCVIVLAYTQELLYVGFHALMLLMAVPVSASCRLSRNDTLILPMNSVQAFASKQNPIIRKHISIVHYIRTRYLDTESI